MWGMGLTLLGLGLRERLRGERRVGARARERRRRVRGGGRAAAGREGAPLRGQHDAAARLALLAHALARVHRAPLALATVHALKYTTIVSVSVLYCLDFSIRGERTKKRTGNSLTTQIRLCLCITVY